MSLRLPVSLGLAGLVSFALFYAMSALVAFDATSGEEELRATPVDFLRVRKESQARRKERRRPERTAPAKRPPPPDLAPPKTASPRLARAPAQVVALPSADVGAPTAGTALSDMDVVPLVRILPEYPARAARAGTTGWVLLEFTVTAAGTVEDVQVVDSDPPGVFDRAATRAAERYKYRPRIRDGKPVSRPGVRVLISFESGEEG